jgi:glycosyltransferase involved in cell wall biosynthesis
MRNKTSEVLERERPEATKRLLVVSWCMPPMLYPRSIQVSRILTGLAHLGWKSTVICGDPGTYPDQVTLDTTLESIYSPFYDQVQVPIPDLHGDAPDFLYREWLKPGTKVVRDQLKKNQFSALITFAQPWVDHLVGLEVRSLQNIPWIAHFSDPWVDSMYYSSLDQSLLQSWRKQERKIVNQANVVIFTNDHARELVMKKYPPQWMRKAFVIPHTMDADLLPGPEPIRPKQDQLLLVYTGDIYGRRIPYGLITALKELALNKPEIKIKIVFVGYCAPEFCQIVQENGLFAMIHFEGKCTYLESQKLAQQADVLLLLDAGSDGASPFLPSKLADYMMHEKPILGITPTSGAAADLLNQLGFKASAPDNVHEIASAIEKVYYAWSNGKLILPDVYLSVKKQYELPTISERFNIVLETSIRNMKKASFF